MSSNRKSPSVNENWIKNESLIDKKNQAKKTVEEENKKHEGMKQVTLPHPTLRNTWKIKYIKVTDEN